MSIINERDEQKQKRLGVCRLGVHEGVRFVGVHDIILQFYFWSNCKMPLLKVLHT